MEVREAAGAGEARGAGVREAAGGAGKERARRGAARALSTTPCAAIAAGPSERETPAATKTQYPRIELVRSSV